MPARIQGYRFTFTGFLPVDPKSVKSQHEASTAMLAAENGDLSALKGVRLVKPVNARFTSIAADPAEAAAEESENEEGPAPDQSPIMDDPSAFDPDDEAATDAAIEAQHGRRRKSA